MAGPDALTRIDAAAGRAVPEITDDPAYPRLRGRLALLVLGGGEPDQLLDDVRGTISLSTADHPAAVLAMWLDEYADRRSGGCVAGPLPWLPPVPTALRGDPTWGEYLARRGERVRDLAEQVRIGTPDRRPPAWLESRGLDARHPLVGEIALWRAARGMAPDDVRPLGATPETAAEQRHFRRLTHALDRATDPLDRDLLAAMTAGPDSLTTDPTWLTVRTRFATAAVEPDDVTQAAARGHLPAEMPAAALYWRVFDGSDRLRRAEQAARRPGPTPSQQPTGPSI